MEDKSKQIPDGFQFQVIWNGKKFGFNRVSGLKRGTEVITHREGGDPSTSKKKIPALRKPGDITLKRGILLNESKSPKTFKNILDNLRENKATKGAATIVMFNERHEAIQTWTISNAVVVKIVSSDLHADGNEVVIEELQLAHEGIKLFDEK